MNYRRALKSNKTDQTDGTPSQIVGPLPLSAPSNTHVYTLSCEVSIWRLAAKPLVERDGRMKEGEATLIRLHHMLMDAANPPQPPHQAPGQLITFAGDTAVVDKVKDKPSVCNSHTASIAG